MTNGKEIKQDLDLPFSLKTALLFTRHFAFDSIAAGLLTAAKLKFSKDFQEHRQVRFISMCVYDL